ncbi:MAG: hypothetical protein QOE90_1151 [Thermoplasmata archaeon]|jgi:hypothetical protein|nr:hypothetical protein [Thermoplasmata archaeon]
MRSILVVLSMLSLAAIALAAPLAVASPAPPPVACAWNHALLPDQYVTYNGFTYAYAGVQFQDGSPLCKVQVVCGGTAFICTLPPL